MDSSPKPFKELLPQIFEDEEHMKNVKNKRIYNKLIARDLL